MPPRYSTRSWGCRKRMPLRVGLIVVLPALSPLLAAALPLVSVGIVAAVVLTFALADTIIGSPPALRENSLTRSRFCARSRRRFEAWELLWTYRGRGSRPARAVARAARADAPS